MKTNSGKYIAVVLSSLFVLGCSSIRARTDTAAADWTIYPGVQKDVKEIGEILSSQRKEPLWVKGLVTTILIADLPFTVVFDTLASPYDLYRLYTPQAQAEAR
jgi:uncharacterized protein YceK